MNRFILDPPPGFQGLSQQKEVQIYRRNLPHWRQDGATYFVTFRLHDAIPPDLRKELNRIKPEARDPSSAAQPKELDDVWKRYVRRLEHCLDDGYGSCLLREPKHSKIVGDALQFFDQSEGLEETGVVPRYELGSYVIMPNHVHAILRPLLPDAHSLEKILQSWKGFTTREINRSRDDGGSLWYQESFDRIVRDAEHLYRCVQYIGRNPRKAGLNEVICPRWIRPSWRKIGWDFLD